MRGDSGAGTVVTLGLALGILALMLVLLPAYAALAARHSAAGAADAAALAAADVARGFEPGFPCAVAARVAAAGGASLESCELDGTVATVVVTRTVAGFALRETATAGPAGSGHD